MISGEEALGRACCNAWDNRFHSGSGDAARACPCRASRRCIASSTDHGRLESRGGSKWADRQLHVAGGNKCRVYDGRVGRVYQHAFRGRRSGDKRSGKRTGQSNLRVKATSLTGDSAWSAVRTLPVHWPRAGSAGETENHHPRRTTPSFTRRKHLLSAGLPSLTHTITYSK